jgi:hypothetical protein
VSILSLSHGAKVRQTQYKLWRTKFYKRKKAKTKYNKGINQAIIAGKHLHRWEELV